MGYGWSVDLGRWFLRRATDPGIGAALGDKSDLSGFPEAGGVVGGAYGSRGRGGKGFSSGGGGFLGTGWGGGMAG